NSSPSALSPTCCTHSNSACLLRAIPSIIGSNSCCAADSRPPPACFASRLFALFLIGGSFPPRGRCCWHDPFSGRPGAAATYSNFNIRGDIAVIAAVDGCGVKVGMTGVSFDVEGFGPWLLDPAVAALPLSLGPSRKHQDRQNRERPNPIAPAKLSLLRSLP